MASERRAECHPDRRYHAKGMCTPCYLQAWADANRDKVEGYRRRHVESDEAHEKRKLRKRNHYFLTTYGMSLEDHEAASLAQGGTCRICGQPPTQGVFTHPPRLFVDHDHATGAVRGLLCGHCNTGLGMFGDDPDRLSAAIEYLTAARLAVPS